MATSADGDKILHDLLDSAIEAKAHYQIWWALANRARPRYVRSMNRFADFFIACQRALFDGMIIHIAHLYDRQRSSSSIEAYLRHAKSHLPTSVVSSVKTQLTQFQGIVRAILTIRHNIVAHKCAGLSERAVFKQAGVTPNQMRDLIHASVRIVESFRRAKGWTNGVFDNERFEQSTLGLLKALDVGRKRVPSVRTSA